MLGVAKLQALAYASTGTASMRSLAADPEAVFEPGLRPCMPIAITGPVLTTPFSYQFTGTTVMLRHQRCSTDTAPRLQRLLCVRRRAWPPTTCAAVVAGGRQFGNIARTPSAPSAARHQQRRRSACTITLTWNESNVAVNAHQAVGNTMSAPTLHPLRSAQRMRTIRTDERSSEKQAARFHHGRADGRSADRAIPTGRAPG